MNEPETRRHILTVGMEDYFQVGAFNRVIQYGQWYRFETRLENNTHRALDLLDRHGIKATFFVLGWVADRFPELVRLVADRGHEVASKGYYHRGIGQMTPAEFRDDCLKAREVIESASGKRVVGYRVADEWFTENDLWAIEILAELGYAYDSSTAPIGRQFSGEPFRRSLHYNESSYGTICELPISTSRLFGMQIPIGGGNYLRQLPQLFIRRAIRRWVENNTAPLVMYFHTWELDPEQPRITAGTWLTHMRHYRNLGRMEAFLEYFFRKYHFTNAADYLGVQTRLTTKPAARPNIRLRITPPGDLLLNQNRTQVSVVIPCYNEELILPYLANTLESVQARLARDYSLTFILVDDGSQDRTWEGMQKTFGHRPGFELYRHEVNRGVAAAILTGIQKSRNEIVCSMDCDCTYDPHELARMIPLLAAGIDLVTASPYHPQGRVRNVPGWRLRLSKGASWLYRRVLRQKLHTYTSCFRVYRRSMVIGLQLRYTGYLGIAELLGRLDLRGAKIVEYPAVLESRMLGRSKMKTMRTIAGHLKLLCRLLACRVNGIRPAGFPILPPVAQPPLQPLPRPVAVEREQQPVAISGG